MTELDEVLAPTILDICRSVMALDVAALDGDAAEDTATYAGCVHLDTEPPGTVVLECDEALARLMAARMFDAAAETLTDADVCDAIGELANMAAGNLKAALPHAARLSLPTVTRGSELKTYLPQSTRVGWRRFACGDDRFSVSVYERAEPAGA
ncbi:MAG: chemotaxis protein CheX [Gemmatimonadetes bacterium]|nr:chemotaxis protein CheX [Gemmatimonadota bacterium]